MRCEHAHDDGAYVLGALSPADRSEYERHLATCRTCRSAVATLAALPGLLARLDVATAESVAAESEASESPWLPNLLRAADQTRRRSRRRDRLRSTVASVAAACLAVVATLGVGLALRDRTGVLPEDSRPAGVVAMEPGPQAQYGTMAGEIALTPVSGGTEVWLHCTYGPSEDWHKPYTFRLYARGTDGATEQIASWTAGPGDDRVLVGVTRFARDELDRLEVHRYDGTAVLVYTVA